MINIHMNLCVAMMIGLLSSPTAQVQGLRLVSTAVTPPPSNVRSLKLDEVDVALEENETDLADVIEEFKTTDTPYRANARAMLKFADSLGSLYENQKLTDCVFTIGPNGEERAFKAHKVVLAAASPVFETAFANASKFRMTDWESSEFGQMLRFVYSGEKCFVDFKEACELLKIFSALAMDAAKDAARNMITQHLNKFRFSDNLAHLWQALHSARQADDQKLLQVIFQFIAERTSDALKNPEFINITQDNLEDLLERTDLNVTSEMEIFDTVMRWGLKRFKNLNQGNKKIRANPDLIRETLGEKIVRNIRFLTMDLTELDIISKRHDNILDYEEITALQQNIRTAGVLEMPDTLSQNVFKRRFIQREFTFKSAQATKLQCGGEDTCADTKHGFQITQLPGSSINMFGIQIPKSLEARKNSSLKERFDVHILNSQNELVYIHKYNQVPPSTAFRVAFNGASLQHSASHTYNDDKLISVKFNLFYRLVSGESYKVKIVFLEDREYPTFVDAGSAIAKSNSLSWSSYGSTSLMGYSNIIYCQIQNSPFIYSVINYYNP